MDREFKDNQTEVGVGCLKYDEDVCEEEEQLEEQRERTQGCASKEAEFSLCEVNEGIVYKGESSMPPPKVS